MLPPLVFPGRAHWVAIIIPRLYFQFSSESSEQRPANQSRARPAAEGKRRHHEQDDGAPDTAWKPFHVKKGEIPWHPFSPTSIWTVIDKVMDKLKLTGRNLGRVFNYRYGYAYTPCRTFITPKLFSLELKTRPKQLLGSLTLAFVLLDQAHFEFFVPSKGEGKVDLTKNGV